jgi:CRISPR-associated endonuclease Csn1
MARILGLDIGTNSIGWAVIEHNTATPSELAGTGKVLGSGARVFTAPVEDKTEAPKNQKRREKRGARRIIARRRLRRDELQEILTSVGLLPSGKEERDTLWNTINPYLVRAKGLAEKLTLHEFGRTLFHLNKRRGFKSNRKADRKEKDKDKGKVLGAIKELSENIARSGAHTLGEYLYKKGETVRIRNQYTHRDMYEDEFNKLWTAQSAFHPELTGDLNVKIHKAIFFQRPLKSQKNLVGFCELEKKIWRLPDGRHIDKGPKRAIKSHPIAQRFRTLQDITNLKINGRPLTAEQTKAIMAAINGKEKLTWVQVKKAAGLHKETKLNLEETGKKHIPGDYTFHRMAKELGKKWDGLDDSQRENLYTDIETIENDGALLKRLAGAWGFSAEESDKLAKVELEDGYAAHSLKAIKKLIPHMEAGLTYPSAKIAAGYGGVSGASEGVNFLPEPPQVRNPVVQKALYETRKVVDAIIREFGKPDIIRVELARDAKLPKKVKDDIRTKNNKRRDENEGINEDLKKEFGLANPTREDRDKYRLWVECNRTSPYSGKAISENQLFSPDVQVEHILPWKRSLDNSYMNRTLCFQNENLEKGDRTPFEAWGYLEQKWGEIETRISHLPLAKRRRFYMTEIPEGFLDSQLTDTRYITKEVCGYLEALGVKVQTNKGLFTSWLRYEWGLASDILPRRKTDEKSGKDRSDHRHHAIDAIVIALTGPWMVHVMSRATSTNGRIRIPNFPAPWHGFREEVKETINNIIVSHRATRKIRGALHEETSYGKTSQPGVFVRRKAIANLSASEVGNIRDARIRQMVEDRISEYGGEIDKALKSEFFIGKTPVKKVRISVKMREDTVFPIKDETGQPYRYVTFGNNHHIEIIKNLKTGKYGGVVVTTMEAARRARIGKKALIQRDHGQDYEFVMSLSINEMVKIPVDGKEECYRVQLLDQASSTITFRKHNSADIKDNSTRLFKNPNTLMQSNVVKITVSPIGEVSKAND